MSILPFILAILIAVVIIVMTFYQKREADLLVNDLTVPQFTKQPVPYFEPVLKYLDSFETLSNYIRKSITSKNSDYIKGLEKIYILNHLKSKFDLPEHAITFKVLENRASLITEAITESIAPKNRNQVMSIFSLLYDKVTFSKDIELKLKSFLQNKENETEIFALYECTYEALKFYKTAEDSKDKVKLKTFYCISKTGEYRFKIESPEEYSETIKISQIEKKLH